MLETIRKYWIGFLVLALVLLHASIVGVIRYQASLAKKDVSCEVMLGDYIAYRTKDDPPLEMTLHAIVPVKQRMKSRQLIELNATQVRQALEEHLRQFDGRYLADPYMTDLRIQLKETLTQLLGPSTIEDVLVTRIRPFSSGRDSLEFVSNTPRPEPRRLVVTLRDQEKEGSDPEEDAGESTHEADASHATHDGHADSESHAAPTKNQNAHAAPAASHSKKPAKPKAAGGHGSKH